ncbi:zinc finger protein 91-like [Nymphalis io]|uniref:zinc finger protein 91-like n=1 Tax=Inachis io TaxID=171585 RepID=UPI00216703C7|nr:zinc finger protein 91-like [Nymphalis io]
MSKSNNDDCTNFIKVYDNNSELFNIQGYRDESYDSIPTSESDFRGFEKVPIVLCQRLDITPFLNKMRYPLAPDIKAKIISNKNANNSSTNKLLLSCSVMLVREDLEKLKEMVKNNTLRNYNCIKCKICDKTYSNLKKLHNHKENKHMIIYKAHNKIPKRVSFSDQIIIHEVKEYHRCRKCPRIFEDYNTLRLHMKQKHKKRRCYICHYCSKDFVDRMFFKVHIKLHCDSCGLLLANKKKYLEHRRFVCRIIKKYKCMTCNMSFFNYMDLKDHSYDHLGTFFICDICKDQFQTKCEVAHHIMFLHTEKHSNELYLKRVDGIYKCNFCKETSDQRHCIQKHVSTLPDLQNSVTTGYKDYCFCNECLKKFTSEKDMLQHKWTHFLKTSDNSQLRNKETETRNKIIKTTYKLTDELPVYLQPKVVLEKIKITNESQWNKKENKPALNIDHFNFKGILKKAVVDPITKKTIISKHKCEECGKYLSSNYCLNRHLYYVHGVVKESNCAKHFKCSHCGEIFLWQSLLKKHNCIRMGPEMHFGDARPEENFDCDNATNQDGFDTYRTSDDDDDDYMNEVDIEIPAPIVQLTEFEHLDIVVNGGNGRLNVINNKTYSLNDLGCKVVLQEVPIEF